MSRSEIEIPSGKLILEGILEFPDGGGDPPFAAGVVCHPHPLYGGNMFNNVVKAVKKALLEKGMACLRFNFRGTGNSGGTYDEGKAERDDVIAALDYLETLGDIDSEAVLVAGYSFGAWVSLAAGNGDSRPRAFVGVSPPLDMYDFDFLKTEKRPKLLVVGDSDFVCSLERFNSLADQIPEPKMIQIFEGADHFHMGNEGRITARVDHFIDGFSIGTR